MSTNYYIQTKTMPQRWGKSMDFVEFLYNRDNEGEYALHLCLITGNWCTLFQATPLFGTFEELIAECERSVAEGAVITDEYGKLFSVEEFKRVVLDYEHREKGETEQRGIKFVTPISHFEYAKKLYKKGINDYYADTNGREFCKRVFS